MIHVSHVWKPKNILLMDEILHHLGPLNYCNSLDCRDLRWCKISSINSSKGNSSEACLFWQTALGLLQTWVVVRIMFPFWVP